MPQRSQYKPLLFTTTLRNPERMKDFLKILSSYDNQILSNELIMEVVHNLISKKMYIPQYVKAVPSLKAKLLNEDVDFTDEETNHIIANSPQNHKEAGFDAGWPSRFDTWYKFLKELGFVYYKINEPIRITESGLKLVAATEEQYHHYEKQVFLNAFVKYQRINPYLKVLNNNKPLILLLQVIKELRASNPNNPGISMKELPLFICWRDNNHHALTEKILDIRRRYRFMPSNEVIYHECKILLGIGSEGETRFKISNICGELPDEFVRKMRLTGLFSIRGLGRFIDINNEESEKIDYILQNYIEIKQFSNNEAEYVEYMSSVDPVFIRTSMSHEATPDIKREHFLQLVSSFDSHILEQELTILSRRNSQSKHNMLKFINEPLRFEFIVAMLLQKKFSNIVVQPNYVTDDEGIPTSFALGNNPDIVCKDSKGNVLFEVSLVSGTQQVTREMIPITRHLEETLVRESEAFSVFVAPTIHSDTNRYIHYIKSTVDLDIVAYDINSLISILRQINNIWQFKTPAR